MMALCGRSLRRNLVMWVSFLALAVVASQYQNCAPAPEGEGQEFVGDNPSGENSSPVSVIDDVNLTTGIDFVQSKIMLDAQDETFSALGICQQEQSGATLSWRLEDGKVKLAEGKAHCEDSSFRVDFLDSQELECGREYVLTARLGRGKEGSTRVSRDCGS